MAKKTKLFTTRQAAEFLGYRDASGVRHLVSRSELIPCGNGPRGTHLFTYQSLIEWTLRYKVSGARNSNSAKKRDSNIDE